MKKYILFSLIFTVFVSAQAQKTGNSLFNASKIHEIRVYFSQTAYWDSLVKNYDFDAYMRGDVKVNGQLYKNVGVQLKGNSSYRTYPGKKKPFKISFDEYVDNQKLDGLKKINLNNGFKDPTMLREKIMLDMLRRQGMLAPRASYANLYLNDQLWGFYTLVEQVDKTFLEDRLDDKKGNLFKGDPNGTLQWKGDAAAQYYTQYELKTNEDVNDWSNLVKLLNAINNSGNEFSTKVEAVLNTKSWLGAWAINNLFVNLDSYNGSGHNYYIYHNSKTDKFEWITWDVNECFGNFNLGLAVPQLETYNIFINPPNRPLINNMLKITGYQNGYTDYLKTFIEKEFTPEKLNKTIDSLANVVRPYVQADPQKMFTNQQFEMNLAQDVGAIPGLKKFVQNRYQSVKTQIEMFINPVTTLSQQADSQIKLYPNPTQDLLIIEQAQPSQLVVMIRDGLGKVWLRAEGSTKDIRLAIQALPQGIYFLEILQAGVTIPLFRKIIKQ